MRIVVQTLGSSGDVDPFVALARRLTSRGHDVHVLANEHFGEAVRATGSSHVEIGDEASYLEVAQHPDLFHPRKGVDVVLEWGVRPTMQPTVEAMRALCVPGETVLVGSTLGFATRLVREVEDVPLVTCHLAPSAFCSVGRMPRFPGPHVPDWMPNVARRAAYRLLAWATDRMFVPAVEDEARRLGLDVPRRVFGQWVHSPDRVLGLWPEWFAPRPADMPERWRLTGFPLSPATPLDESLAAWLDEGDPPIVFTAGSANHAAARFFSAATEACRRLGRRGILATGNPADVPGDLPGGVRHVRWAPFRTLLPRAAALVGHGGIGTTAHGLAAGVPQLTAPMGFDQFDNSDWLERLGTGRALPMRRFTGERAAAALDTLLNDRDVAAAVARAARLATERDTIDAACDEIVVAGGLAPAR